ncbi:MAG: hypothetical protein JXA69_07395 [Phycisphaerae bacterium]|nr:hypothetical protein [Phycisphaerae bacterium]
MARIAEHVAGFPELAAHRVDRAALIAAALYHDAGWAVQFRRGELERVELLTRPVNEPQRELAASLLEALPANVLSEGSRILAARAIRECNRKASQQVEAHILAEATNLDDIGPQAVWATARRHFAEAKGVDAMLEAWHRQQEYHYWEARLKECFRYPASRRLARRRLEAVERFMNDLRQCHRLEDIDELSAGPSPLRQVLADRP